MSKKKEDTETLMKRLGGSLVSWLTFQQSARRSKMYKERWMYGAIYEIAAARNWTVWPEYPVNIANKTHYVDFVFYGGTNKHDKTDPLAALEISYIKKNTKKEKVLKDENKLRAITVHKLEPKAGTSTKKFLMIVGKYSELRDYSSKYVPPAMPLFSNEKKCNIGWIYLSPYPYPDKQRWCAIVLVVGQEKLCSIKANAD